MVYPFHVPSHMCSYHRLCCILPIFSEVNIRILCSGGLVAWFVNVYTKAFMFLWNIFFERPWIEDYRDRINKVVYLLPSLCFFNSVPCREGVLGSEDIAPRLLNLGTRWRRLISFTLRPLYPQGNRLWYPLFRRLGGPQSRSGRGGEEKNS
jgi:hypothetical protein